MNKNILIDSGFWYSLYNPRDEYHTHALSLADLLVNNKVLIPWPTLYETLNTRFCRNLNAINGISNFINNPDNVLIDDIEYKNYELKELFTSKRTYSLVDRTIRAILMDRNIKIDYFITYNVSDFIDLCAYRKIEVLTND